MTDTDICQPVAMTDDPFDAMFGPTIPRSVAGAAVSERQVPDIRSIDELVLSTGERIPLDADVVLGRDPRPVDGSSGVPRLVELPFPDVSRLHAVVRIARRIATIEDLGSVNGTTVTSPHGRPERIASGVPVGLDVGTTVELGDLVSFTIEDAA